MDLLGKGVVTVEDHQYIIETKVIHITDLSNTSRLWVSNALMGFRQARLVDFSINSSSKDQN